jgi:membrane fusion protein, adhesin transport system
MKSPSPALAALVASPWASRVAGHAVLVLLAITIVALIITPWQQNIAGDGRVIAFSPVERHQRLESPIDGRIARVLVAEGQVVSEGELLIEVADVDPQLMARLEGEQQLVNMRVAAADLRLSSITDRVASLRQSRDMALVGAAARVDMANERVRQAEQALVATAAAKEAAALNLPRIRDLAEQGLRSARDRELAELDINRATAEDSRAKALLVAATAEVASLVADRVRVDKDTSASINDAKAQEQVAQAEIAAARGELIRLQTRIARQETQSVRAPRDATVFRISAQESQLVKQGEPLAELVPTTASRAVEIWVDGNDAPLVQAGRHVRLQFEGWPALQFSGWPQVARGTFGGEVSLVDAHDDGTGKFRLVVVPIAAEPWPDGTILRQGVRTHGWVMLEQVSLGYELWRRLNGFPPRLDRSKATKTSAKAESK